MLRKQAIKPKYGHCVDCPDHAPDKPLTAGRCSVHYWQYRHKVSCSKHKEQLGKEGVIGAKEILDVSMIDGTLQGWFSYWMRFCGFKCEECGEVISRSDIAGLQASQAHILPKADSMFQSVKTVIHNHLTLGARCGCHSRFDKSWDAAQKMKVWPLAVQKFKWFCHLISPREVRKLPPVLREIYDQTMIERMI